MAEVLLGTQWGNASEDSSGAAGVLTGVLGAYQGQGYEWGYRRGVSDVLGMLLLLTEDYVRQQQGDPDDLRRLLHGFEAYVEAQFDHPADRGFVTGGLGI